MEHLMGSGFDTALSELTLVLFTTLAPSGALAFVLVALYLVFAKIEEDDRRKIDKMLILPLTVSMVGLIASSTHLGNPANALYVFLGVGRSPLSTEVFFAVIFLLLAGLYWIYSFSTRTIPTLQKAWLLAIATASLAFITAVAFAYSARTIVGWSSVFTPINLWLNALVGGPLLALLTFQLSGHKKIAETKYAGILCAISVAALLVNMLSMLVQNTGLESIGNSCTSATTLISVYPLFIAGFVVLGLIAQILFLASIKRKTLPSLKMSILACVLVFLGIFLTRFAFYMMHMTVGLSM